MSKHSQTILDQLYEYDSFLDSLTTIADMGCGTGEDILWWANLTTRDDPPEPHNYKCYAIDRDETKLSKLPDLPNLYKLNRDFTELSLPVKVDFIWSHDSLQYSTNPLDTLKLWNKQMNVDGMLVLCVPQHNGVEFNKYYSRTYDGCFYNFTPTSLLYMLAVNGFDCKDAYLLKKFNDPWIHIAVYKSNIEPLDPKTTSWGDLADAGLLNEYLTQCIFKYGHIRQEEILYPWLDRENYFVDYIPQYTQIPENAETIDLNSPADLNSYKTKESEISQAKPVTKESKLINKPIKSIQPRKKYE